MTGARASKILSLHDRTGRVVRIGEDEELGLRRDGRLELLRLGGTVLLLQIDGDRAVHASTVQGSHRTRKRSWGIGTSSPGLISAHGKVDALRAADRHQNLVQVVVVHPLGAL